MFTLSTYCASIMCNRSLSLLLDVFIMLSRFPGKMVCVKAADCYSGNYAARNNQRYEARRAIRVQFWKLNLLCFSRPCKQTPAGKFFQLSCSTGMYFTLSSGTPQEVYAVFYAVFFAIDNPANACLYYQFCTFYAWRSRYVKRGSVAVVAGARYLGNGICLCVQNVWLGDIVFVLANVLEARQGCCCSRRLLSFCPLL